MSEHYPHPGRSEGGPRQYNDDPSAGSGRDGPRMYRSYDRERSFGSRSPPRYQRPPHQTLPKDSKRLYINQLPQDVNEELLRTIFSKFGNITRCDIPRYGSGNNKGYAFIIFDSPDAAKKAIERSDSITINGSHVSIEYGFEKGFHPHDGEYRGRGSRGRYFPRGDFGHHQYPPRPRYDNYRHSPPRGHYDDEPRHFKERGGYMRGGRGFNPRYRDNYRDRPRSPRYNYHPPERDTQDLPVQPAVKQLPNEPIPTTSKFQEAPGQKQQGALPGAPPSNTVGGAQTHPEGQDEYEEGLIKEQGVENREPRNEPLSREHSSQQENNQRFVRREERNPKDNNGNGQTDKNLDSNERLFEETKAPQGDLHTKRFHDAGQVYDVYRGGAIGYKFRGQYNYHSRGRFVPRGYYKQRRSPGREDYHHYHHQDRYKHQGGNRERSRYGPQMRYDYRQDNTIMAERNEMRNSPPYRRNRPFDSYPRYQQRDSYDRE